MSTSHPGVQDATLQYETHVGFPVESNDSELGANHGNAGQGHSPDHTPENDFFSAEEMEESRYVHPEAQWVFQKYPWMRYIPVYGIAVEGFGLRCTWALGLVYMLCKGIADYILQFSSYAMFRSRFGVDATRYQRLNSILTTGWSIKAFTAMICDAFSFFGYTKRWYMLLSCVAGAAFAVIYGVLPGKPSSANLGCALVFLSCFCKANVDILSEGHYSRLIRRNPKAGPALVSWIWWFISLGAMIAAVITGPLSDGGRQQVAVFVSAALQLFTGLFFLFNWYGEKPNRIERAIDAQILHHERRAEEAKQLAALNDANSSIHDLVTLPYEKNLYPEREMNDGSDSNHEDTPNAPEEFLQDELAPPREGPFDSITNIHSNDNALEMHVPEATMNHTEHLPYSYSTANSRNISALSHIDFEYNKAIPCLFGVFEFNKEIVQRNPRIFVYCVVMTLCVIAMTCGTILASTLGMFLISAISSIICCGMSVWAMPKVIAKANMFSFLQMVFYIQIQGVTDSFYMATPDCLPDAPHFSYTFYSTIGQIISNLAAIGGVTGFTYIFSKRGYRLTMCVTTLIQMVASIFDIVIVKRWNVKVGIPDHATYICGAAIVYQVCYMLSWMPMAVLMSRLCPRGSESVMYALMAGFGNLGQSTSQSIGALLMQYAWPIVSNPPCDFHNAAWLLFVGHMLCPIVIFPLTLLLPSARVCDDIDVDGNVIIKDEPADNTNNNNNNNNEHTSGNGVIMKNKEVAATGSSNVLSTLNEEDVQHNLNDATTKKTGAIQHGESTNSHGEPIDDFATQDHIKNGNNM